METIQELNKFYEAHSSRGLKAEIIMEWKYLEGCFLFLFIEGGSTSALWWCNVDLNKKLTPGCQEIF